MIHFDFDSYTNAEDRNGCFYGFLHFLPSGSWVRFFSQATCDHMFALKRDAWKTVIQVCHFFMISTPGDSSCDLSWMIIKWPFQRLERWPPLWITSPCFLKQPLALIFFPDITTFFPAWCVNCFSQKKTGNIFFGGDFGSHNINIFERCTVNLSPRNFWVQLCQRKRFIYSLLSQWNSQCSSGHPK